MRTRLHRAGYQRCRSRLGRWRRAQLAWIGVALLLSLTAGAYGATATNVVPSGGKVAGHGYDYWLQRLWQRNFSSTLPVRACATLTSNGHRVGLLAGRTNNPGTFRYTCSEPAGRPLYVPVLSAECSTFNGDHGSFGTSDQELLRCAPAILNALGFQKSITVDRQPVDLGKLLKATGVYPVHAVKNNAAGVAPGNGRSAAYGYGLLLTDLGKGTHVIHLLNSHGTTKADYTFTVHVH